MSVAGEGMGLFRLFYLFLLVSFLIREWVTYAISLFVSSLGFTFRECVRLANLLVFPDTSAHCFVLRQFISVRTFSCYFSLTGIGPYRLF